MSDVLLQFLSASPIQLLIILFFVTVILRSRAGLAIVNGLLGSKGSNGTEYKPSDASLLIKIREIHKDVLSEHERIEVIKLDHMIELLAEIRDELREHRH